MTNEVKDDVLKKVSGGTEEGFKYVLCTRDWVYDNSFKTIKVHIEENVSTNDTGTEVLVVKRSRDEEYDDGSGRIHMTVKQILDRYEKYGGQLHNM